MYLLDRESAQRGACQHSQSDADPGVSVHEPVPPVGEHDFATVEGGISGRIVLGRFGWRHGEGQGGVFVSTRQRHNWFGKKDLDDFDGRPVIGIAVAAMATTQRQRLCGSGSRGSRCLSLADYVMETGPRRGRPLPEGAKVGILRRVKRACGSLCPARMTGASTRPVKGAPLRGRGGPCPTPLTGRCAGWGTAKKEMG